MKMVGAVSSAPCRREIRPRRSRFSGMRARRSRRGILKVAMDKLRAVVRKGRFVIDAPTTLPEGTVLDLVVDDEGDDLTDEERAALHAALEQGIGEAKAGKGRPANDVIKDLRRPR
jgi:hypothetical protein